MLGENTFRRLLTEDWLERKKCHFELISGEELVKYVSSGEQFKTDEFLTSNSLPKDMSYCKSFIEEKTDDQNIWDFIGVWLVKRHKGKLALCGGYALHLFKYNSDTADITGVNYMDLDNDLFFYNTNPIEAEEIILDCIKYIKNVLKTFIETKNVGNDESVGKHHLYVTRNNHTVNINIQCQKKGDGVYGVYGEKCDDIFREDVVKIQFILRIYPNIGLIIGGFDIPAAAIAYDGDTFHATKLGAWTNKNNTIIVDISRSSTSFEHRLNKYYCRGFQLLFPGIRSKNIVHYPEKIADRTYLYNVLKQEADKYCYSIVKSNDFVDSNLDFAMACLKEKAIKINKQDLKTKIKEICERFSNPTEEDVNQILLKYFQVNSSKIDKRQMIEILKNRANELGYFLSITEQDFWDPDYFYDLISPYERRIIISDRLSLNWLNDIRLTRVYGKFDKKLRTISDYGETPIHFPRIKYANATCLANNNLEFIITHFYIDLSMSDEDVENIFRDNLLHPNIGPVLEAWMDEVTRLEYEHTPTRLLKAYSEYGLKFLSMEKEEKEEVRRIMIKRIIENEAESIKRLTGLHWITENPGRQWTSSFNPIIEDPRKWYKQEYTKFEVGIPEEIETQLRLFRVQKENRGFNVFAILPKDIFNKILLKLAEIWWRE